MKASAVAIEGSQADQGRDFLPVEKSQFRQVGQQRNDGDLADAGNGLDDIPFAFPFIVRFEKLGVPAGPFMQLHGLLSRSRMRYRKRRRSMR